MERFRQLVEELNQQLITGASPELLRQTLALLNLELDRDAGSTTRSLGTAKVAVVLPQTPLQVDRSAEPDSTPAISEGASATDNIPKLNPLVLFDEEFVVEKLIPPTPSPKEEGSITYNVMEEVPTLYMHRDTELNEKLLSDIPSLNDQLKTSSEDRYHTLQEGPIADLRRAIGVNERFQFIRELFRNDEAMYERSIKTINQFQVLNEADFWINRELKTKLGWPVDHPLVTLFDQLVRRRFS
ncbi:MAG: hypothetical protein FJX92_05355 [Bacteroidetes bacterium]|nr:hypothetical protein [Bacteroidota bacterium]